MEYVIEAEVRIEFKRLVDRFNYKRGEEFDGFKYEPVQDVAKRYSDGEDRFLKMFDYAMERVNETIWAVDDYLKLYTGRILEDMYYNLGVNEWNRDDRPEGVRIGANLNLNLILVMIEDMIDFLYGI